MAIHFRQHPKVGEKAVAEAGFGLGDGHSTGVEYERKTPVNRAVFWFAVALPMVGACGPSIVAARCACGHLRTLRRVQAPRLGHHIRS